MSEPRSNPGTDTSDGLSHLRCGKCTGARDALLAQLLVPSLIFLLMGSTGVGCALGGSSSNCLSGRDFSNAFAEADAPIMPMSP